jgi:hypothetical protein
VGYEERCQEYRDVEKVGKLWSRQSVLWVLTSLSLNHKKVNDIFLLLYTDTILFPFCEAGLPIF